MKRTSEGIRTTLPRDLIAGVVVFLVAIPLCLGVALLSNAPPLSGIIAGIIGGIVVGWLSGSQSSVCGPAAGLTAVVAVQIATIGSFQGFLVAVVLAGILQIVMGCCRLGLIAGYFPTCVIKGLLAAIGIILILKQIPHLFGHDTDPPDDMSFQQVTGGNTFISLYETAFDFDFATTLIGLACVAVLIVWDRFKPLKRSLIPAPLIVVILGVAFVEWFRSIGGHWTLIPEHLVTIPVSESFSDLKKLLAFPDFSALTSRGV